MDKYRQTKESKFLANLEESSYKKYIVHQSKLSVAAKNMKKFWGYTSESKLSKGDR